MPTNPPSEKTNPSAITFLLKLLLFITAAWFGMIIAIAFEAVIRPKTPELLPEHRGLMFIITRTVFESFQKIELILCMVSLFIFTRIKKNYLELILPVLILIVCLVESFVFMPQLALRSLQVFQGETLAPSNIHFYNLSAEAIKLLLLLWIFKEVSNKLTQSIT